MRVVVDTNVLVRAVTRPNGSARRLLQIMLSEQHVLLTSPFIFDEVRRVLAYPRIVRCTIVTAVEAQAIIDAMVMGSECYPDADDGLGRVIGDKDDQPVLSLAVIGRADAICTMNRHFHTDTVISMCAAHGIRVVTDVELLGM